MGHRILVTGGGGYLGSVMVPELLASGHHVTVVDNFRYNDQSLAHLCYHKDFELVRGDVRVEKLMQGLVAKADIVIPLAALVGAPICQADPVGATTINRDAVMMLFGMMSKSQWILMPTTNSAYGQRDNDKFCDETTPLNPISLYARDKVEVEDALLKRENSISFRLATVFGMSPRMRIDLLVNDFVHRAVHDKFIVLFESHFKRNFIHVRDVARVFLHGIQAFDKMKGQIYNVGLSDANLSKLDLCEAIRKQIPAFVIKEAEVGKDPDQRDYIVSNAKLEKTGFETKFHLEAGIKELIKGYQMMKNTRYGNV